MSSTYAVKTRSSMDSSRRKSTSNMFDGTKNGEPSTPNVISSSPQRASSTGRVKKLSSKKKSARKSSAKKVAAELESEVEAKGEADVQTEAEMDTEEAPVPIITHELMAEEMTDTDNEVEIEVQEMMSEQTQADAPEETVDPIIQTIQDAETVSTAAATAAIYQAALSFAQQPQRKQSSSSSSVASTPTRIRSSLLASTASSAIKARSFTTPAHGTLLSSSSMPDTLHSITTPAWRPSSARPVAVTLTTPYSPKLRVNERSKTCARPVPLSSEEQEARRIQEETRQLTEQFRRNKTHFEKVKALAANAKEIPAASVRSTKQLTIPTTPAFLTTKRNGPKIASNTAAAAPKEEETKPKRLNFDDAAPGPKKPTLFEPFKFATDARLSANPSTNGAIVIPAAQIAANFLHDARRYEASKANVCKGVTVPISPHFRKRGSARPKPLSREEKEAAEMEEAKKHAFKARPVDKRVFESTGDMGVPKVSSRSTTTIREFALRTDVRATVPRVQETKAAKESNVPSSTFKARPMPCFEETQYVGVPSTPAFKPTIAHSPKFTTKHAASAPARRQLPHHTVAEHEKQSALHASRAVTKPSITEPAPFALRSVARHADSVAQFSEVIRQVESRFKEVEFHATPCPKTTYEAPQTPRLGDDRVQRPPLVDIQFQSSVRASKRAEFDNKVAAHKAEDEKNKLVEKSMAAEQENKEVAKLRRMSTADGGLMFKAQPVVTKDMYPTPKVAAQPPTMPKSPFLLTKQRALANARTEVRVSELAAALASM